MIFKIILLIRMEKISQLNCRRRDNYEKTIKTIGAIAIVSVITFGSYLFGTTQAETMTEIQTVTETKEVIPDGYIDTNSDDLLIIM